MVARQTAHVPEVTSPRSTRIMTCANHKGGTGKTTTAVNVSAGLALLTQQRVLLYMRRLILHHFYMASICKVCVLMLSTGCGEKNDAKLSAVCISRLLEESYFSLMTSAPPPTTVPSISPGARPSA